MRWDAFTTLREALQSPRAAAQRHRLARNRLIAEEAVARAAEKGVRVIEVDGSRDAGEMAGVVAGHFREYLQSGLDNNRRPSSVKPFVA